MTTNTLHPPAATRRTRLAWLTRPGLRVLVLVSVLSAFMLLLALVGLSTDGRTITGAPAWLKPSKFAVSIAVYCATLAWMLSLVRDHPRLVRTVARVTGGALALELVLIITQVVRGTTSHFNVADPFDARLFDAMGGLVALVFFAAVAAGVLLTRQRGLPRVLGAGIRAGIAVSVLGMAEAILMLVNRTVAPGGAHTVGAADGGPGLPLTGWSTEHGDLRIAHFTGLHCLQALPLLAWALQRYATRLGEVTQLRLVRLATVSAAGVVALLAWQAERGLPLLRPESAVVGVALAGALLVGVAATLLVGRDLRAAGVRS